MATRTFNNAVINGVTVATKDFVGGSGEITVTGSDTMKVTDDHIMHHLRLNVHYEAKFKTFRDYRELETDPNVNVFGGTQYFYLDLVEVASFPGIVAIEEFNELENTTSLKVRGSAEDAY